MEIIKMEIMVIKDGTTEEMVYNGLELLEEFATKLLNQMIMQ